MDEIRKHVRQARRRLNLQGLGRWLVWTLAVAFGVALPALALRKVFTLGQVDPLIWKWGWLLGALVVGALAALVLAWVSRRDDLDAAIEIDRRFDLKERVSSSLMLHSSELNSEFGQALLSDTQRRVARLEVPAEFLLRASRWTLLPAALAGVAFAVALLIPDAVFDSSASTADAAATAEAKQVKTSFQSLEKKLAERAEQRREETPSETDKLLEELQRGIEQLAKREDIDQKKALIQLNDLAKKIEERREQLGGHEALRQQLNQLANMQQGPADRLADQLRKGDFNAANKELQKLAEQLKNDQLTDEQKEKLAKQLDEMQNQLEQMLQAREEAKQAMKEEIERKRLSGDLAAAENLQRQLDQLSKSDAQMAKLGEMAARMSQASQALKSGDSKQAQQQFAQMAEGLKQMDGELAELQSLTESMSELEGAKLSMNCAQCQGAGCSLCQGSAMGNSMSNRIGSGMGRGRGMGERPEEETDTSHYESRVQARPQGGTSVVSGTVAGPNTPGDPLLDVREAIGADASAQQDPLEGLHLPREQRDIAREYFHIYREGVD